MKKIGIIGAMPSELADIRATLQNPEIVTKSGFDYYCCQISAETQVIHACSGISKVNAALCAQVLIDTFQPDAIINTGIAGGMNSEVKVCDIVISSEVLSHDLDMHLLNDYPPYCSVFPANDRLMQLAADICDASSINHFFGRIVSGEQFISDNAVKQDIVNRLNPYAVDMESAAIGHCAFMNQIPFVSVRCISDNADDGGELSFDQFEKIAAKRVADIVLKMVEQF